MQDSIMLTYSGERAEAGCRQTIASIAVLLLMPGNVFSTRYPQMREVTARASSHEADDIQLNSDMHESRNSAESGGHEMQHEQATPSAKNLATIKQTLTLPSHWPYASASSTKAKNPKPQNVVPRHSCASDSTTTLCAFFRGGEAFQTKKHDRRVD
jgi:hypothetical protein